MCDSVLSEWPEVDLVDVYNTRMRQVLDSHAPLKTRRVPVRPSAPWTGEEIREANRALHRTERWANRSKLTVHREIFLKQRNLLRK